MLATQSPYPQYFDLDGSPLDGGAIYFGVADQNPEIAPITVYWDAAGTQPAAQPIRTINGALREPGKRYAPGRAKPPITEPPADEPRPQTIH